MRTILYSILMKRKHQTQAKILHVKRFYYKLIIINSNFCQMKDESVDGFDALTATFDS